MIFVIHSISSVFSFYAFCHTSRLVEATGIKSTSFLTEKSIEISRQNAVNKIFGILIPTVLTICNPHPSHAYTADSDPVKESLYFVSRVQEATVQQGVYVDTFISKWPFSEYII